MAFQYCCKGRGKAGVLRDTLMAFQYCCKGRGKAGVLRDTLMAFLYCKGRRPEGRSNGLPKKLGGVPSPVEGEIIQQQDQSSSYKVQQRQP